MPKRASVDRVAVIGLGRFGAAVAETLVEHGHEVIGIDAVEAAVTNLAQKLPHVVQADSTDTQALRDLGLAEVDHAVVAIGTDLEASVLTVMALTEIGVRDIWAKAMDRRHGQILARLGAHHISYPEADQGKRVAHLIDGQLSDFLSFSDGFSVGATIVPAEYTGRTLSALGLRAKHGVTVIGYKRAGQEFVYADQNAILAPGDEILIGGSAGSVRRFADLTIPVGKA